MTGYVSTRGQAPAVDPVQAILASLAPDGGLYVPQHFLRVDSGDLGGADDLATTTAALLAPFFAGAPGTVAAQLPVICRSALAFDMPLRPLAGDPQAWLLELFHGPGGTFKDIGARFLAHLLPALPATADDDPGDGAGRRLLVAGCGTTGAALAHACRDVPGLDVVILHPQGRVSSRQAGQLAAWGARVVAVHGDLDHCQALLRSVLADTGLQRRRLLLAGSSLNLGWLLPQLGSWAHTAVRFQRRYGRLLNVIVPTGNLGNACAALLVRALGLPIGEVVLATNANRLQTGVEAGPARPRAVATLAPAMDVAMPTNLERLRWLYPDPVALRRRVPVHSVDDQRIRETIIATDHQHGVAVCPHTACAMAVLADLRAGRDTRPWAVAATAHPAGFAPVVEPLIGRQLPVPETLASPDPLPAAGGHSAIVAADYPSLRRLLLAA